MGKSILRDLVILLVIFGSAWGIIALFPVFPEKVEMIGVEKEQELGDAYVEMILKSTDFRLLESAKADSVVGTITQRLLGAMDHSPYDYRFLMVEETMINAFALPGGHVIITSGLLQFAGSAEELAAVIAHEMGHIEMQHVIGRVVKELGIKVLTSGDPFVMGEVMKILASTGYDRRQEKEADHFACELLEKASIEPRMLASFFRKIRQEQGNELFEKFEIVSTHPNFTSRIRYILEYLPDDDFESVPLEIDWEKFMDALEVPE